MLKKVTDTILYVGANDHEVDLFEGDNEGLVVAEVELPDTKCQPPLPEWIWKEVTSDYHYRNSYLVKVPYKTWFK